MNKYKELKKHGRLLHKKLNFHGHISMVLFHIDISHHFVFNKKFYLIVCSIIFNGGEIE